MKKLLSLFLLTILLTSCEENLKFSNPGFQGMRNDVFWRAKNTRAYLDTDGDLTIEGLVQLEKVVLGTTSTNVGKYTLGSTDANNFASYTATIDGLDYEFKTISVPGPVSGTSIVSGGSGYEADCTLNSDTNTYECPTSRETTGGSGTGLRVSIGTNASGVVNFIRVVSPGNGYQAGDLITVTGGNLNCRFRVMNVQGSNGEIQITKYDNVKKTVSGTFKFNAVSVDSPLSGQVVNYQYGEFYNVPIVSSAQ